MGSVARAIRGSEVKKKLTVRGNNALKPAEPGTRYNIWDTEVPNFGVCVTDTGKISFNVMPHWPQGSARPTHCRRASLRCGEYTEGLLTQAREDARAAIRDMSQGINPKAKTEPEREAVRAAAAERSANAFEAVAEDFIKRHVLATDKGRPKPKSGPEVAATIRREIISKWRGRPIVDIARRDVVKLLEEVVDDGRASVAHHLLAYHPQTQGQIERWHQTLKNRILLERHYLPGDLERQVAAFVEHYARLGRRLAPPGERRRHA
jgi:Arm DNA-binding domain